MRPKIYFSVLLPGTHMERSLNGGLVSWQTLATKWDEDYLLHLTADPKNANTLHAVAGKSGQDGGKTWGPFGAASSR